MELAEKKLRIIEKVSTLDDEMKVEQIYPLPSEDEIVNIINESLVDYKEGRTTDFKDLIEEIKHW